MALTTDQVRQELQRLWTANFLNIPAATRGCLDHFRRRLDIGFELPGVVFDDQGGFQPHAEDCLRFLSRSDHFGLIVLTGVADEVAQALLHRHCTPLGIRIHGLNANPLYDDIAWNPKKPHVDVLFDPLTQFNPARGDWFWAMRLLSVSLEMLSSPTMDTGTNIIRKSDQYAVRPVHTSSVFRKPIL